MKSILSALIFTLFSAAALAQFDCTQREAQFTGVIKNKRVHKVDNGLYDCYFQISFLSYQASGACPLQAGEVANQEIAATTCDFENNDAISGYLVEQNGQLRVE